MPETTNKREMNSTTCSRAKAEGAFIALAAGDALGWPQELRSKGREKGKPATASMEFHTWTYRGGHRFYPHEELIQAGEYSDDTQLTLAVARSLSVAGLDWWNTFTRTEIPLWTLYERGGGRSTKLAAESWVKGVPPWKNNDEDAVRRYFDAGGNGVAMRILPHAVFYVAEEDPSVLVRDVFADGLATHGHPRALVGATAYAYAAWWLLRSLNTIRFGEVVDVLLDSVSDWGMLPVTTHASSDWLKIADRGSRERYEALWNQVVKEMCELLERVRRGLASGAIADDDEVLGEIGSFGQMKGAGTISVAASLYLNARYAAQPAQAVLKAAFATGADTDTLAAMTGGLMGCLAGNDWLPREWFDVQDCDYLRRVANAVARGPKGTEERQPNLRLISKKDLDAFLTDLVSNRKDELDLDGLRRASVTDLFASKSLSKSTMAYSWKLRTSDGQTLYITKLSRKSEDEPTAPTVQRKIPESPIMRTTVIQNDHGLRLNLIPIAFDNDSFKGYELRYIDPHHLRQLRERYRQTYVFRRRGDVIQCIPLAESAEPLGEEKQFNLKNDFVLVAHLVEEALIRFFEERNVEFSRLVHPTRIVVEKENLMKEVIGRDEIASLLPMHPEYEVESRLIIPHDKLVTFAILVNFSVRHLINGTVSDFLRKKIDLHNRYVVIDREDLPSIVSGKYNKKLAGRIIGIEGATLKLADYLNKSEIDSNSCFLESSQSNYLHCLASLSTEALSQIKKRRMAQIFKLTGTRNQYERLEKVKKWLADSEPITCAQGLTFRISSDIYKLNPGKEAGQYRQLSNPYYVLRPGGSITVTGRVDRHMDEKGPFDTEDFPNKRVRIAVICPERFKGDVEVFIKQFKDGVPPRPGKDIPYTQGFIRKYRLTSCDFDFFEIKSGNENPNGYKEASIEALREAHGYDLAIIVIREEFHLLYGRQNPYFIAKSTFMSQAVPVQFIEIETVQDEKGRPWILNNIALASYAKIGGIPWVLSAPPGMTHELIFGIGSSMVRTERLGGRERFVGITTVFSGDGNYLLYNLTKEVKFEEYQNALLQSLKDCMDEIKARYAWQKGDKVRLIFHQAFKKFKKLEADAVKRFVHSITDFDVEYAFVHISRRHSWKIFDKQSKGVSHWEKENGKFKKTTKGEYVPQRGLYVPLGPRAALLTLTGPYQLKTSLQGCPEPILISVHNESTFSSQDYLVNQIYKLTFMSWRSFFPSTMPVTIEYSDMIAYFMGHLRDIPGWNPDTLFTKLREKRWFL